MILVTGASGQLGRLVIEELLTTVPADEIIAAVRSPEKVQDLADKGVVVREADYARPETLTAAFAGVDKALLISSSEIGQRTAQHKAVIDAAKTNAVQLLAYTSLLRADTSPMQLAEEHKATEAYLEKSGVPHVILRNGWYTENYAMGVGTALQLGAVFGCAGEGKISSAARADYAAAAAKVLTLDNQAGKIYELAGDKAYTLSEFAETVSELTGKSIAYQNLSEADYAKALVDAGLPEGFAAILADSDTGVSNGHLFENSGQLASLIGRPTTPLTEVIKAFL
ncbi:MAG: SDR family oxidoreductase [Reinekea sp.]|jgi:NAD(P)H dehydrogenase (quinone)